MEKRNPVDIRPIVWFLSAIIHVYAMINEMLLAPPVVGIEELNASFPVLARFREPD